MFSAHFSEICLVYISKLNWLKLNYKKKCYVNIRNFNRYVSDETNVYGKNNRIIKSWWNFNKYTVLWTIEDVCNLIIV